MPRPTVYVGFTPYSFRHPLPRGPLGDVGSFYSLSRYVDSWNTGPASWQGYGDAWGDAVPTQPSPVPTAPTVAVSTLQELLPLVTDLSTQLTDPYAASQIYRERAERARRLGFETRARVLEAKAAAADRRIGVKAAAETSSQEWSTLGKIGLITGIGVGISMMVFFVGKSRK